MQNLIFCPYIYNFGSDPQKRTWIPKLVSGEYIGAIALTEPSTGSDLAAIRTTATRYGDHYRVNGQKMFITLGGCADLIMLACRTDSKAGSKGISLLMVETHRTPGFTRGAPLRKMGLHAHTTTPLYFDDAIVPASNLLGDKHGSGMRQMMHNLAQERLVCAMESMAMIDRALQVTIDYVKSRKAFGKTVMDFQNTQFTLADCKAEATAAHAFLKQSIDKQHAGQLSEVEAAMAKLWFTELQGRIMDRCLQLFGGYGYMEEYPICQMYQDARVSRIYGGTSEIMKLIIARSL
jgi:acyl-CoA dehydrogenase